MLDIPLLGVFTELTCSSLGFITAALETIGMFRRIHCLHFARNLKNSARSCHDSRRQSEVQGKGIHCETQLRLAHHLPGCDQPLVVVNFGCWTDF